MKSSATSKRALTNFLERAFQRTLTDEYDSGAVPIVEAVAELTDLTTVEREAADWITLIADPDCTEEQLAQLDVWLGRNEENPRVFAELQAIWGQSEWAADEPAGDLSHGIATLDAGVASRSLTLKRLTALIEDPARAEDLLRAIYQWLLRLEPSSFEKIESVTDYLHVVGRQVALDFLRKEEKDPRLFHIDGKIDITDSQTDEMDRSVESAYVRKLLRRLARDRPDALRLSTHEHLHAHSEMTRVMGLSINRVKKYGARAIQALRNAVAGASDE